MKSVRRLTPCGIGGESIGVFDVLPMLIPFPAFMDMPFVGSVEEAGYEAKLSALLGRLRAQISAPTEPSL